MVSGAGDAIAVSMCFEIWTCCFHKFSNSMHNGVDPFAFVIPFTALVWYLFRSSGRDSKYIKPPTSVVTGMKHCYSELLVDFELQRCCGCHSTCRFGHLWYADRVFSVVTIGEYRCWS